MKAQVISDAACRVETDALAAVVFESRSGGDANLDALSGGLVGELRGTGELNGKLLETTLVQRPAGAKAGRLVLVGGGKADEFDPARARRCAAAAVRALKGNGVRRLAWQAESVDHRFVEAIVEGSVLGRFEGDAHRTEERRQLALEELLVLGEGAPPSAVETGLVLGEAQNFARDLAQEPGNLLPPRKLAERAGAMASEAGLDCEVLEEAKIRELGMGGLLGVAQGSAEPAVLITLRYVPQGRRTEGEHLGLVGKGVTFDTGGVSIKPSEDMDRMKYDMAGAAAVLGAMRAITALKPPVPVTAIVPAAENMVSAKAQRPGDVVTTMSGKTVEILNTDAEGRMLLADALTYAQRLGCTRLLDLATLTGSMVIALGYERSGLFSNNAEWGRCVLEASEQAGERFWPMPLDEEYRGYLESQVADLPNIGSRWGGAITAAMFLKQFADPTPWAHLDIAGTAWLEKAPPDAPKGPTGVGVRSMVQLAFSMG